MTIATYTKSGTKAATSAKLDKKIFGVVPENHELVKAAYIAYLANGRDNHAVTKTRGLIRGGGKKPWKQKGTGRARFGSSRNPIWRGGGVVFGPTGNENYSHKMNQTAKRRAICQALSLSADSGKLKVIETFTAMDGKTKAMAKFLAKIEATGNVLCVVSEKDTSKERATNNLPNVIVCSAKYLNVYNLINADTVIVSQKALAVISEWLAEAKEPAAVSSEKPAKVEAKS